MYPCRNPALKTIPELANDLDRVARFKQALDSAQAQKYLGENNEKMLNCGLTDTQSSLLSIEGFWPAIPGLTTVQDCIDDPLSRSSKVIESPFRINRADNFYGIMNICNEHNPNPNPRQPITAYRNGMQLFFFICFYFLFSFMNLMNSRFEDNHLAEIRVEDSNRCSL